MPEINPNIALQGQQPNFLQLAGNVGQVSNALLGAQAQRQQIQANLATSDAFKQATDPTTGETDWNKLRGLIAGGPAAYNLPQINQAITNNQISQQDLAKKQYDLAFQKQQQTADQLGSLAAMGPSITHQDVTNKVAKMVSDGTLTTEQAIKELGTMPSNQAELQPWIKQHAYAAVSGLQRMQMMNPDVMPVNNGQGTVLINKNLSSAAPYGVIGNVQNQLSPSELAQRVEVIGENNRPGLITNQEFLQGRGKLPGNQPQGQGISSGYTGRYPQGQVPQGPTSTGLSPAEQSALTTQGGSAAKEAANLSESASNSPTRINVLQQARAVLANPNVQTGPGTDWRNMAKSFFGALAPDTAKALGSADSVGDRDEFVKLMNNYANQASAGLGTGTDSRLNVAIAGNANPQISKMANQDILAKTIALEKMQQAKNYAWQNSGLSDTSPQKYQQWSSQWNKTVNPGVFIFDELNDSQKEKYFKGMNPKDQQQFRSDYNKAKHVGLL